MTERNSSGGNLIVAVIIAVIVGVVVYFLIDTRPAGELHNSVATSGTVTSGDMPSQEVMTGQ